MAFTFSQLKTAKQNIMDRYGLDSGSASRVVGFFSSDPAKVQQLINNDMAPVPVALSALGLAEKITQESAHDCGHDQVAQHTADITQGSASASQASKDQGTAQRSAGAPHLLEPVHDQVEKNVSRKEKTSPKRSARKDQRTASIHDQLPKRSAGDMHTTAPYREPLAGDNAPSSPLQAHETAQAFNSPATIETSQTDDIIQDPIDDQHALPAGLYDDICATIDYYCQEHDISDRMKIHPLQWQGICYRVGESIKKRKILHDFAREKVHGGTVYDGNKITALLSLYSVICSDFKQVAFTFNFARFAGVSTDYLHDYMHKGLTSARVGLREKALDIQRASLVGAVTGGGSATVGNIFLSKALAGLQETVTVQHVSASPAPVVDSIPDLSRIGDNNG